MTDQTQGPSIERAVGQLAFGARAIATGNVAVSAIIWLVVFRAWRAPALAIDLVATIIMALLAVSAAGLVTRVKWERTVTRIAAIALLAVGLFVVSALTLGMTFFRAVGGPGAGPGPMIYLLAVMLALPYAVGYPIGLLLWLRARGRAP